MCIYCVQIYWIILLIILVSIIMMSLSSSASAKTEDAEYHLLHSTEGGKQQAGLMSSDTCLSSFVACLRFLAPRFLLVSWFPSWCCAESEDSTDDEFNSVNSLQRRLYDLFSAFRVIFSSRPDVLHTVILTVCKYKPCQQSKPHQF